MSQQPQNDSENRSAAGCTATPWNCDGFGLCFDRTSRPAGCHPEPIANASCVTSNVNLTWKYWNALIFGGVGNSFGRPQPGCRFSCNVGFHRARCSLGCVECRLDGVEEMAAGSVLQVLVVTGLMVFAYCFFRCWCNGPGNVFEAAAKRWSIEVNCPSIHAEDYDLLGTTCAICLQIFQPLEKVRRLPCKPAGIATHCFHAKCIDRWFQNSQNCPMCKQDHSDVLQWTLWRRQAPDDERSSVTEVVHCCGREESRSLIREIDTESY